MSLDAGRQGGNTSVTLAVAAAPQLTGRQA
jgi:hypothetical protein